MEYALINKETNIVENVIVLEDINAWPVPENMFLVSLTEVDPEAGIKDTWDGTKFIYTSDPNYNNPETQVVDGEAPNVIG